MACSLNLHQFSSPTTIAGRTFSETASSKMSSGMSTPSSQATTLVGSPNLRATLDRENRATSLPSSAILEYYSSKASSAIFLYDLAREAGLGNVVRTLRGTESVQEHAVVFDIQSRAGAGLTLLGRISEGTSSAATKALTAYTTPSGLAQMQPVLGLFPQPSSGSRLVLQIPTITHWGEDLAILPTLANLTPFFSSIPENFSVLLSATPQEIIDFAAISYSISGSHVIHIFDQWSAGRQVSNKKTSYQTVSVPSPTSGIHTEFTRAGYSFFEYVGPTDASDIIVILNGPLALATKNILTIIPSLGVVIVKVLRPWDETNLRGVIPPSAQTIHVLDDVSSTTSSTPLYHDVLGAMASPSSKTTRISSIRLETKTLSQVLVSAQSLVGYLSSILPINWFAAPEIPARASKRIVFYSNPTSSLREVPSVASQLFVSNPNINAQLLQNVDAFSKPGGVAQSTLTIGSTKDGVDDTPIPFKNGQSSDTDALMILDSSLLKTHDVFSELKEGSPVLIVTTWGGEEVISNLSRANLETIGIKKPHLLLVNAEATAANLRTPALDIVVSYAAFLRLYLGQVAKYDVLAALLTSLFGKEVHGVSIDKIARASWDALQSIPLPGLTVTEDEVVPSREFTFNTIEANSTDSLPQPVVKTSSWIEAAKNFVFREAFAISGEPVPSTEFRQNPALRPDLAEHRFLVTCTVNRRLTPLEYNRNVFHLEFDTHGTGLKYEIGEALGVHGWNDEHEVLNFCKWYGLNPDDVISIPVGGDPTKRHVRTIFQAFQQQIDIFGKPPKGFYEALSGYAKGREDRMALRFISSAEGSSTFKKLSELETVTFADVLQKFSSAKPPVEALCEIVGDIKPRHYSIASAQSAVGDRVDLLVVTVEWANPSGSPRYGQCTRYLAALKPGQKVTVSIKPSVMKLPPSNLQPIIMAGLGTGAAPFRAFMQHRAMLASKNIPVGPMLYYFGSRHRSEEYLYGEEIEAFLQDGVITHAGLAFSRDEKRKVYIQHKMLQDGRMLSDMLGQQKGQKGVFYLCGPTWPVPDVFEAIVGALVEYEGMDRTFAEQYIEDLKEEERYVLEVY